MRWLASGLFVALVSGVFGCSKNATDAANTEALRAEVAKTEAVKAELAKAEAAKAEADKQTHAAVTELVQTRTTLAKVELELKTIRDADEVAKSRVKHRTEAFLQTIVAVGNHGASSPQVVRSLDQAVGMMTQAAADEYANTAKNAGVPIMLRDEKNLTFNAIGLYKYLGAEPFNKVVNVGGLDKITFVVESVRVEEGRKQATAKAKVKRSTELVVATLDLEYAGDAASGVWRVSRFRLDLPSP